MDILFDVSVKVDKFTFLMNFVMLDCNMDLGVSIFLSLLFLTRG